MSALVILLLILAVLLVIFTLQNSIEITIHVFFWDIPNAPLVLVLLACILIGYLLATIYFYPILWKVRREHKKMLRFNEELQQLHKMEHPEPEKIDPEGISLDDEDDDEDTFFKD